MPSLYARALPSLLLTLTLCAACTDAPADRPPVRLDPVDMRATVEDMPAAADMREAPDLPSASDMPTTQDMAQAEDMAPDLSPEVDMAPPVTSGARLATGVTLARVDVYQTVQTTLMRERQPETTEQVPLLAGKASLVRLFVTLAPGQAARDVVAQVRVRSMAGTIEAFEQAFTVTRDSDAFDRSSIIELRLPPEAMTPGAHMAVSLRDEAAALTADDAAHPARWPATEDFVDLEVSEAPGPLNIVIVPFRYDYDGSGRMPDTSPQQLDLFEAMLRAAYPATNVSLTVRAAVPWDRPVDWGDFNVKLREVRADDDPPYGTFYYGYIRPRDTFAEYCSGTCTTGQSFTVSSATADSYRVGSGVGFTGERWGWTLLHELGHMMGRGHAPCGLSLFSPRDRSYPYSGANIGVWAWSARTGTIFPPQSATDFMGYCDDLWVSDYTYMGIHDRQVATRQAAGTLASRPMRRWRAIRWSQADGARLGRLTRAREAGTGESAEVEVLGSGGALVRRVRVPLARMAHGGEVVWMVPERALVGGKAVRVVTPARQTASVALR